MYPMGCSGCAFSHLKIKETIHIETVRALSRTIRVVAFQVIVTVNPAKLNTAILTTTTNEHTKIDKLFPIIVIASAISSNRGCVCETTENDTCQGMRYIGKRSKQQ